MPEATVISSTQLICTGCGEDVFTCDICDVEFKEGEDIVCGENDDSETNFHRHKTCE